MATINLGAIKFNWKGAYNNSTAYAVDDVVSSGGSSYVCILASTGNATSNGTYWEQMSSAGTNGTNGTDLTSTLTTQGDILYRDGSGLQRLGAGTSGNVLTTKGSGQNPVWEAASGGKLLNYAFGYSDTSHGTTSTSFVDSNLQVTITPTSQSSIIYVVATFGSGYTITSSSHAVTLYNSTNSTYLPSKRIGASSSLNSVSHFTELPGLSGMYRVPNVISAFDNQLANTNAQTYKVRHYVQNSGGTGYINMQNTTGCITAMEFGV